MNPIAFTIPFPVAELGPITTGPLDIRWYGLMMAASMLIGAWISATLLNKLGRKGDLVWDALFWIILCSIAGARLVYCLTNLGEFTGEQAQWWSWFAVWQGGLSFHGGVLGGAIATYFCFKDKIPFIEVADSMVPGLSLGIILVRFGNFMNGDILGYKWEGPWAMNFPHDQYHFMQQQAVINRHPTELYGLFVGLICLVTCFALWNETYGSHTMRVGAPLFGFMLTYSLARSIFEDPFRAVPLPWKVVDPEVAGYGLFTSSHLLSFFIIAVALVGFQALKTYAEHMADLEKSGFGKVKGKSAAEKAKVG